MRSLAYVLTSLLALSPSVLSAAVESTGDVAPSTCQSPSVISETTIGEYGKVKVQAVHCDNADAVHGLKIAADSPPANVCGAPCTTYCWSPAGGGPDPNECHVIADALRYDSQNVGALFTIPANASVITMQYQSCKSFFVNQAGYDEQYCRTDWAAVLDYVAYNCQAQQNAHGGLCVAGDQRWFIQVQNVDG